MENQIQNLPEKYLDVFVERILPGGLGLAHAEGLTVMVALAAPGDLLRVRIDRVKGTVAFASIREILTPSPERVTPPCPYFGKCGGCDFQQLAYQFQLTTKLEIIRDCLRRIAGLTELPEISIAAAPNEWHYRSRAQWQYDAVRRRLGYFESGSRHVCDVAECAVLTPELETELERLRSEMREGSLPEDARYFRAIAGDTSCSIASDKRLDVDEVSRTIAGERYFFDAEAFFQTNNDLLPALIDYAIGDRRGEKAIELYSGVGLFTLPLARRFANVVAVEGDKAASRFARKSLRAAGVANAKVVSQDVALWLENSPAGKVDFLLLDPPRTGAESKVVNGISNIKPRRICYVSCDPATLARDLKKLLASGFVIDRLAAFDMFPQTHHVETVVHLTG